MRMLNYKKNPEKHTNNPNIMPQYSVIGDSLTFTEANAALEKLLAFCAQQHDDKALDLSNITHCDSAGIAVLIEIKKYVLQQQNTIRLKNPSKQLRSMAQFLQVDDLLFS